MAGSTSETPVLDLLASMTADSINASSLDDNTLMLVRIAALVAVDAPSVSYLPNLAAASETGLDAEQVRVFSQPSRRLSARHGSRPRPPGSPRRSTSQSRSRSLRSRTRE